jgi:hypothetical protein
MLATPINKHHRSNGRQGSRVGLCIHRLCIRVHGEPVMTLEQEGQLC